MDEAEPMKSSLDIADAIISWLMDGTGYEYQVTDREDIALIIDGRVKPVDWAHMNI